MASRRSLLSAGGFWLAGLALPALARAGAPVVDIEMRGDVNGSKVWFDPIGLRVEAGTAIRWTTRQNVHTATAYHPDNDDHSLRIPKTAQPWDSGYLVEPGDRFSVVLTVPGVYDYYCAPHEHAGMVGRIVVDTPTGPGVRPFDYFKSFKPVPPWTDVPPAAQVNFPTVEEIMRKGRVVPPRN